MSVNARSRHGCSRSSDIIERHFDGPVDPARDPLPDHPSGAQYEAQTPTDYDGNETADNVDDEEEGTLSVLDDAINDSVEEELKAVFEDLGENQLAEVSPLLGRPGHLDASDWDEALREKPTN